MKKRVLEKGELSFVLLLGIFSLVCFIASLYIFIKAPTLNGEGTVPLITSAILLIMTVVILFEMRVCPQGFAKNTAFGQKAKEVLAFLFPGQVGIIIAYCLVYAVMLGIVGFAASTFIFLAASMLTLNHENKIRPFAISIITLVCIMVLFQYIFKVQLP